MSRRTASVIAGLVAVVLAGCGIPQDSAPTVLPGGVVNPALAAGDGQPQAGAAVRPEADAQIFLVQAEQLVSVRRVAPRGDLAGVLTLLLQGPTEAEFAAGSRTAISPQTTLRSARLDGDTAVVDLSGALVEVGGEEQILAVAQIVLTATAVAGVGQVRLLLEGQAVEVPRADGTLTSDALRAADYAGLLR
ncbi:MAG TPA: GerMN domain-containing protein [Acidimicrobiia bacterium]|nr:GerMN domain-containing protein [Acidimicrobiia bacterium]